MTPACGLGQPESARQGLYSKPIGRRGEEIRKWLEDAPRLGAKHQVRRYAVLDDEVEPILKNIPGKFVFACDPARGLTKKTAEQVIQYFSN